MKTEYSIECESCHAYNISPIKCQDCFKKEILRMIDEMSKFQKYIWVEELKKRIEEEK